MRRCGWRVEAGGEDGGREDGGERMEVGREEARRGSAAGGGPPSAQTYRRRGSHKKNKAATTEASPGPELRAPRPLGPLCQRHCMLGQPGPLWI